MACAEYENYVPCAQTQMSLKMRRQRAYFKSKAEGLGYRSCLQKEIDEVIKRKFSGSKLRKGTSPVFTLEESTLFGDYSDLEVRTAYMLRDAALTAQAAEAMNKINQTIERMQNRMYRTEFKVTMFSKERVTTSKVFVRLKNLSQGGDVSVTAVKEETFIKKRYGVLKSFVEMGFPFAAAVAFKDGACYGGNHMKNMEGRVVEIKDLTTEGKQRYPMYDCTAEDVLCKLEWFKNVHYETQKEV